LEFYFCGKRTLAELHSFVSQMDVMVSQMDVFLVSQMDVFLVSQIDVISAAAKTSRLVLDRDDLLLAACI